MSANKTIKALREERAQLYAEIRRLQAAAGEQPTIRQMARDARSGLRAEPSATAEHEQGIPGTSFQRLNMLANQGE
ncbi:hypothetical protein D3C77_410330 [compost metagenome]